MKHDSTQKSNLEHALAYAASGLHVFPLRTDGDTKMPHPCTHRDKKNTGGHNTATDDADEITRLWTRYPTAGIGVACAKSGLIVVDVDPRNGGLETLEVLKRQHGPEMFETSVRCNSPSGGFHLYYRVPEGVGRVPGKLGDGIDLKYNGYVILPPSPHPKHPDIPYAWADGRSWEDGEWLLTPFPRNLVRVQTIIAEDPDDPFADVGKGVMGYDIERVAEIVGKVKNEDLDYDSWFAMLAGIWHETSGSDEGREIAHGWSSKSDKHTDAKFDKTWESLNHDGNPNPTTFRYCVKRAKEDTKDEREANLAEINRQFMTAYNAEEIGAARMAAKKLAVADPIERLMMESAYRTAIKRITTQNISPAQAKKDLAHENPDITIAPKWCASVAYVTARKAFYDWRMGVEIEKDAFNDIHARAAMTEEDILRGETKPANLPSDLALNRYGVPVVWQLGYDPAQRHEEDPIYRMDGMRYVNTYSDRLAIRVPEGDITGDGRRAIKTFERYLGVLFPDDRDRALVLSAIRYIVVERKRLGFGVLLCNAEGTGKTILLDFLRRLVGVNNATVISGMQLQEKFNEWAFGKLVVVAEELSAFKAEGRFDTMNALKPLITNETFSMRAMRQAAREVRNTCNVWMTTNDLNALPITRRDTRIFVPRMGLPTPSSVAYFKVENPHFFERVLDAMQSQGGWIKKWLIDEVEYHPDFKPGNRAPATWAKEALIDELEAETVTQRLRTIIADSTRPDVSMDLLGTAALRAEAERQDRLDWLVEARFLPRALIQMGFGKIGRVQWNNPRYAGGDENDGTWAEQRYYGDNPDKYLRPDGKPDREKIRDRIDPEL